MRSLLLALAFWGLGCGGPSPPDFHDERWLKFGVEPSVEADRLRDQFEAAGLAIERRIDGETFSALSARNADGTSTMVRVVTRRGTVLAFDAEPELGRPARVELELLPPPLQHTHDADDDGFEEVFVVGEAGRRRCVQGYRIVAKGYMKEVESDATALGQDACIARVTDVNRDGVVEGMVPFEHPALACPTLPSVEVPLVVDEGAFRYRPSAPVVRTWLRRRAAVRQGEVASARDAGRVEDVYRLAVELAALESLQGRERRAQVERFDAALEGVTLPDTLAACVSRARGFIYRGWRSADAEDEDGSEPDASPPTDTQPPETQQASPPPPR